MFLKMFLNSSKASREEKIEKIYGKNVDYIAPADNENILNTFIETQQATISAPGTVKDEFREYKICRVIFGKNTTKRFFEKAISSIDKKKFDIVEIVFDKGFSFLEEDIQGICEANNLKIAECTDSSAKSASTNDKTGLVNMVRQSPLFEFNNFQIKLPEEKDPIFTITDKWSWFSKSALEEIMSNTRPIKQKYHTGGEVLEIHRDKNKYIIGRFNKKIGYLLGFDKKSKNLEEFINNLDRDCISTDDYKILIFDGIKLTEEHLRLIFKKIQNKKRIEMIVKTADGKSEIKQDRIHIFFRNCELPENIKNIYLEMTHFNIYRFYENGETFLSDYKKNNPEAIVLQRFLKK